MDIGTISLVLLVGLLVLLAIGMPLGLASAVMAVAVLVMKFEPALIADPLSLATGCSRENLAPVRSTYWRRKSMGCSRITF